MKSAHRAVESRFQRRRNPRSNLAAASWDEGALSALKPNAIGSFLSANGSACKDGLGQLSVVKANAAGNFLSANGAALNDSLGQRPRAPGTITLLALKARFTSVELAPTSRPTQNK
jgi:hypothetical protein